MVLLEEKHKEKLRKQNLDSFDCIVLLHFLENFLKFATQKMVDYQRKSREGCGRENDRQLLLSQVCRRQMSIGGGKFGFRLRLLLSKV